MHVRCLDHRLRRFEISEMGWEWGVMQEKQDVQTKADEMSFSRAEC